MLHFKHIQPQSRSQGPLSTSRNTLVTAGHVSKHTNSSCTGGGSSTLFCQHCLGWWMLRCYTDVIFKKEASSLSEILPDHCFVSTWTSIIMRCWLRRNYAHISLLFLVTVKNLLRISLISSSHHREIINGLHSTRSTFLTENWIYHLTVTK